MSPTPRVRNHSYFSTSLLLSGEEARHRLPYGANRAIRSVGEGALGALRTPSSSQYPSAPNGRGAFGTSQHGGKTLKKKTSFAALVLSVVAAVLMSAAPAS